MLAKIESDQFPIIHTLPCDDKSSRKDKNAFRSTKNFGIDTMKEKLANISLSDKANDPKKSEKICNQEIIGIYSTMRLFLIQAKETRISV